MGLALPKQLNKTVINEWAWLESRIYLGWLSAFLCEVWTMKTVCKVCLIPVPSKKQIQTSILYSTLCVMEFNVEERDCGDREYIGGQCFSIRKGLKEENIGKLKLTEPSMNSSNSIPFNLRHTSITLSDLMRV